MEPNTEENRLDIETKLKFKRFEQFLNDNDIKFHYNHIMNLISDVSKFDMGFEIACLNVDANTDYSIDAQMHNFQKKISSLMVFDRLICIAGLGHFRDKIMESYLDSMFNSKHIDLKTLLKEISR